MIGAYSFANVGMPALDLDAFNYVKSAGITSAAQALRAHQLIVELKYLGLWSRIYAMYPIMGATAATHAANARNPGVNTLTYRNAPAHTAQGIRFNPAATQLANTGYTSAQYPINQGAAIDYYSADNTSIGGDIIEMGGWQPQDGGVLLAIKIASISSLAFGRIGGSGYQGIASTVSPSTSAGLFSIDRSNATNIVTLYQNGIGTAPPTLFTTVPPTSFFPITLGALAQASDPVGAGAFGYSDRGCSFACIRGSFTAAETLLYYTAIQKFQLANSRNV